MAPVSAFRRSRSRPRAVGLLVSLIVVLSACSDTTDGVATDSSAPTQDSTSATGDPATSVTSGDGTTAGPLPTPTDGTSDTAGANGETDPPPSEPWDTADFTLAPVGSMTEPIALRTRPGSDDLWVLERAGRVRLIERTLDTAAGTESLRQLTTPVLDLTDRVSSDGEGGLLGLAFSADGKKLYVYYTDLDFFSVVSEFPVGDKTADRDAERILLRIEQPFSNHNGGDLHFGPDGMLYTGLGDGGSGDDPLGSGQDTSTVLGALLRIDPTPSGDKPYTVPADNPFASGGGAPEIWSWGLRNPWRFSFDADTGDLWIADVGQGRVEEIDFLPNKADGAGRGANLGWNLMEGNEEFRGEPAPADHVGPIHDYPHEDGNCSVTGGYVYRGAFTPDLEGVYVYADVCTTDIVGIERRADGSVKVAPLNLDRGAERVISFGQGPGDEIYVLEGGGRISRLQAADLPLETTLSNG